MTFLRSWIGVGHDGGSEVAGVGGACRRSGGRAVKVAVTHGAVVWRGGVHVPAKACDGPAHERLQSFPDAAPVREQRRSGLGVLNVKRSDEVDCEIATKVSARPFAVWSRRRPQILEFMSHIGSSSDVSYSRRT
jgi:hypothetical protein